jgi:TonB family protein
VTSISVAGSLRRLIRVLPALTLLIYLSVVSRAQSPVEPTRSVADPAATDPAKPSVVAPQSAAEPANADPNKSAAALQTRLGRARALIAAHRLDTAASELESVRSAARDSMLRNITSIMLMSVYLEDGNYGRAEALLEETYQGRAAQKDESLGTYFALAGQAVNGARAHLTRYRSFGVNTADASLPAEAVNDLNRLRSLLERMIAQAKEISKDRRAYDSLSLLEDVLGIRLSLAKDGEDQARWEVEYAGAREALASSQTQIASLGGVPPLRSGQVPMKKATGPSPYSTKKVGESSLEIKAPEKKDESATEQPATNAAAPKPAAAPPASKTEDARSQTSGTKPSPLPVSDVGSLNEAATKRVVPRYPPLAKQTGATGLVRVHVIVDETGKVVSVSRSEGPVLLRQAAEDAARQWSFQTTPTDGQPLRLKGYIDFNFSL